mmetsp:Transcript_6319/g.12418  ORF Transcript_6319/g.12418 Transcript_6319/m.12418 type:complete len:216 (+) Transcript_6319:107-754(+)
MSIDTSLLKEELRTLYEEKRAVEQEVEECVGRLESCGVGVEESLVDSEGFPRSDLDLVSVRMDRQRVHVLNNDHARLMAQIEGKLHKLHAHTRGDVDVSAPIQHTRSYVEEERVAAPLAVPAKSTLPFAIVDEVSQDGPAMHAGVAVGDKVLQCAHITGQTPNSLATMGSLVSESENRVLDLIVLRGDNVVRLKLHPKKWSGRGLLGCHLSPMRE